MIVLIIATLAIITTALAAYAWYLQIQERRRRAALIRDLEEQIATLEADITRIFNTATFKASNLTVRRKP